jgi:hypothetical protein
MERKRRHQRRQAPLDQVEAAAELEITPAIPNSAAKGGVFLFRNGAKALGELCAAPRSLLLVRDCEEWKKLEVTKHMAFIQIPLQ